MGSGDKSQGGWIGGWIPRYDMFPRQILPQGISPESPLAARTRTPLEWIHHGARPLSSMPGLRYGYSFLWEIVSNMVGGHDTPVSYVSERVHFHLSFIPAGWFCLVFLQENPALKLAICFCLSIGETISAAPWIDD